MASSGVERLADAHIPRAQLESAFVAFGDELRSLCTAKAARGAIDMDAAVEAEIWQTQCGAAAEL